LVLSDGACPPLRDLGRCCNGHAVEKMLSVGDLTLLGGVGNVNEGRSIISKVEGLGIHLSNGQGTGD
jgi:hypothetical protein